MIQNQVQNWNMMSPESQQRIMDAAKNAGYMQSAKGQSFFMPNWMKGGKMGQMEEQLGRRIIPQAMSPDDWQKITPMASLKGDAYRQYQDFTNLLREEQQRANFQKYAGEMGFKPQAQGAMGKDPSIAPTPRPLTRPTPGNMPQQPQVPLGRPVNLTNDVQPIPRPIARPTPGNMPQAGMPMGGMWPPKANYWTNPNIRLSPEQQATLRRGGLRLVNALG